MADRPTSPANKDQASQGVPVGLMSEPDHPWCQPVEGEDLPTPIWSGSFMLGDLELRCHVLSDGRRIIEAECLEALFGGDGPTLDAADLEAFAKWSRGSDV